MKTVVITGANGQLGSLFVNAILEQGYFVIAVDKYHSTELASEMLQKVILDITSEHEVHAFFAKLQHIDILINNAGVGVFSSFEKRTAAEFREVMEVNLLGTFLMMQGAVELMKKAGGGKIINIASVYGTKSSDYRIYGNSGRNNSEVYSATKAGVISLTKYAAAHFGQKNIQVNSVSPGGIFNNQAAEFVDNYESKTPMRRMGTPEDLRSTILYLIDDRTSYLNGQDIAIDGGFLTW